MHAGAAPTLHGSTVCRAPCCLKDEVLEENKG